MNSPCLAVPRRLQSSFTKAQLKTYCDKLGVPLQASEAKIKQAYYKKSLLHHPDRNQGNKQSVKLFAEINEAYQALLSDRRDSNESQDFSNRWKFKSNTEFRTWQGRRTETKRGQGSSWQNVHPDDDQQSRDNYMETSNDTRSGWYGRFYAQSVARDFAIHRAERAKRTSQPESKPNNESCVVM
uniref:dnaJ homolog subfamily B member 9-like n=1 Tax=Styela clava TaxID=7725 RepID=UPI00193ABD49|nr:dnaJ homolog subfamily B member 9-like [Styela clava]